METSGVTFVSDPVDPRGESRGLAKTYDIN